MVGSLSAVVARGDHQNQEPIAAPPGIPDVHDVPEDVPAAPPGIPDVHDVPEAAAAPIIRMQRQHIPHPDPMKSHLYVRISTDHEEYWYFRAVCSTCGASKSGTCKAPATRTSGSQKHRGQGRPGGLTWSWLLHAGTLPPHHDREAHKAWDSSFASRAHGRCDLERQPSCDSFCRSLERSPSPGPRPRADDPSTLEPYDLPLR